MRAQSISLRSRQRGISLIMTMIMLVIIGFTAAAAMRGSQSTEKVVNNLRSEALAQQYAEAALRVCEAEMLKPTADRPLKLQDANVAVIVVGGATGWEQPVTWTGSGRYEIPESQLKTSDSSFVPPTLPQCQVEKQVLPDGVGRATVVTARGFSPDYKADASGNTIAGSVVWLQSMSALN